MTYMLANIMFYGVDSDPGETKMDVLFFSTSWTEIRIGQQGLVLLVRACKLYVLS